MIDSPALHMWPSRNPDHPQQKTTKHFKGTEKYLG
jgi:hypothetical protein